MASTTEPIDADLLALLRCPETMQTLALAPVAVLERIAQERLPDRGGRVPESLAAGLLREDGTLLYPIQAGIPIMLSDSAIPLPI